MSPQYTPLRSELRPVVIINEHSSNTGSVEHQLEQLGIKPAERIPTERDEADTHDAMYGRLRLGDLVLVDGGDATAGSVVTGTLSPQGRALGLDNNLMVFGKGGYANDLANMLNGGADLARILAHPEERRVAPIQFVVSHGSDILIDRSVPTYIGVGASALAAAAADRLKQDPRPIVQRKKFGRKAIAAWACVKAIAEAPDLLLHDLLSEEELSLSDRSLIRGDIIAIEGRPHGDLRLNRFEQLDSVAGGRIAAAASMVRMKQGWSRGAILMKSLFKVYSANGSEVDVHADGDLRTVPSGSTFDARISPYSFRTIASRLDTRAA